MKLRNLFCAMMSAATVLPAMAVPAQPGIVERHMPDGTVVNVRIFGDEYAHYVLSEDGWPVIEENGTLWFAEPDTDGALRASGHAVARRDAGTAKWLASLSQTELVRTVAGRYDMHRNRSTMRRNPGLHYSSFPHIGAPRAIVILVEYQDVKCSTRNAGDYFRRMLNEEGFSLWGGTGSVRDYFIDSSNGRFTPDFDVYGPVTLPEPMAYYGANTGKDGDDAHAEDMAVHACQLLDHTVDFSQYDHDGDGLIDNVFIFYAGRGEASGGSGDTVWPHSWDVRAAYADTGGRFFFDGVELGHYACTNEWKGDRPDGIGTFVHEFSHVLGLPDLYVTTGGTPGFTPGAWDVLDYGPYSNLSRTPPSYSTFARYALDWIEPEVLGKPDNVTLCPLTGSDDACIVFPNDNPNEYFLFENRQQQGQDRFLPGHGMLIWHVDYDADVWENGGVNNDPSHHHVDLIEADNMLTETSRAGDAFPGSGNITSFTSDGHPAFNDWNGNPMPPVTSIEELRGVISFKFDGGLPDSQAPTALEASDVGSYSFTALWESVPDAESYRLTVTEDGNGDPMLCKEFDNSVTSYKIEGMAPETKYFYTVTATQSGKGISPESNIIEVTTGPATFEWLEPVALEPRDVTDTRFTAAWLPVEGSTEYFVTLFNKSDIITEPDEQGFDGGPGDIPGDWTCTTTLRFDNAGYSGKDVPSLRFSGTRQGYIESGIYPTDIHSVSFWHRGLDKTAGNLITADALVDGEWIRIGQVEVTEQEGGRSDTVSGFPFGARAVRLTYMTEGSRRGPLALDDVCVNREVSFTKETVNGIDRKSAGPDTAMTISGLAPDTEYWYCVVATDGTLFSRESKPMRVVTKEMGGIREADIAADGIDARYYNLQGIEIKNPATGGIVIEVRADKARVVRIGPSLPL